MAAEQAWYIAQRAEALATLFLTRRNDLEVFPSGRGAGPLGAVAGSVARDLVDRRG